MSVNDQAGMVFHRPMPSRGGAAPQRNIWFKKPMGWFHHQRPVIDQNRLPTDRIEPVFGIQLVPRTTVQHQRIGQWPIHRQA